jgi:hypothetical protein
MGPFEIIRVVNPINDNEHGVAMHLELIIEAPADLGHYAGDIPFTFARPD